MKYAKITKTSLVLLVLMAFLSQAMAAAATTMTDRLSVDINSATTGGNDCAPEGVGHFTVNFTDNNAGIDGNGFAQFAVKIRASGIGAYDSNATVADDGNGTVSNGIITTNNFGLAGVRLTIATGLLLGKIDLNFYSVDGNANSAAVNVITAYILPGLITATEFSDINSSLCGLTNLASITPKLNYATSSNYIQFLTAIDLNKSPVLDLDANINMDSTTAQVYGNSGLSLSGKSATVYFGNTTGSGVNNPEVWYRPSDNTGDAVMLCPGSVCSNLGFTDGTTQFDVTGFSYYELRDKSTGMGKKLLATGQIPYSGTAPAQQGTTNAAFTAIAAAITGTKLQIGSVGIPVVYLATLLVLIVGVYVLFIHGKK